MRCVMYLCFFNPLLNLWNQTIMTLRNLVKNNVLLSKRCAECAGSIIVAVVSI